MEYHWQNIRDQAAQVFGDHPTGQLEADLIEHFEADPERTIRTIDRIKQAHTKKPFNSPWAVIRADLNKPIAANVTASDTTSRQARIDKAKQWIDNAGLHYDRQDHVLADLFGDEYSRGPLTSYDTPELRQELTDYWLEQRPRGEQAERDHEAWNAKAKANRALVLALKAKQQPQPATPTSPDIDFDS